MNKELQWKSLKSLAFSCASSGCKVLKTIQHCAGHTVYLLKSAPLLVSTGNKNAESSVTEFMSTECIRYAIPLNLRDLYL